MTLHFFKTCDIMNFVISPNFFIGKIMMKSRSNMDRKNKNKKKICIFKLKIDLSIFI